MQAEQIEARMRELKAALERDRENAIRRNPIHRKDFDNAIGAVETAISHYKSGRMDAFRMVWRKNVSLKAVATNYDEFADVASALE